MTTKPSKLQQLFLYCVAPIACSIIVGFIFFHGRVPDRHNAAFQFVLTSVIASIFYYLLVLAKPRDAYLGLVLLLLFTLVTTGSTRAAFILRDTLYVGAIGLSMLLYFRYFPRPGHLRYLYPPIVLAVIYGLVNVVASEINLLIISMFSTWSFRDSCLTVASNAISFSVVIGFAVGCGLALNDRFAPLETHA
jgi:hypothetical protein